jgi:hypothetical protein
MKHSLRTAVAIAALTVAGHAQAATFNLNLTGALANGNTNTFTSGPDTFRTWQLSLNGFGNTVFLNAGDTVNATVTLDGAFTVPGSNEMFIGFDLLGDFLPVGASNNGSMTFFSFSGPTGLSNNTVGTNCGNCLSSIAFLGAQGPVTFNQIQTSFTIDTLTTVDFPAYGAQLSYQLRDMTSAVPEPATWAMMLIGFGLVGAAMRRGTRVRVTYA